MPAYRIVEWERPPQLVEVPVPAPGPGQLLVRVAGNGLCHSDLTMAQIPGMFAEPLGWHAPFTLGHEIAGWVAEVGAGVTGVAEGDPVALVSPSSCGTCEFCVRGRDSACPDGLVGRGYGRDGGLASFVLVDGTRGVIKLGGLDPLAAGPLTDAGATSYHGIRRVLPHLTPGSTAVVIGAGGLGSFAIQFLRALSPATVVAVDNNESRLPYARELGAHHTVVGVSKSTADDLRTLTGGRGAEAVLDFVGIDHTISTGIGAVRPFGAFALIGSNGGTFNRPWYGGLPRDAEVFHFQGSSIADAHDVVALAESGRIRSDVDLFDLADVESAYQHMESGTLRGRAVVRPPTG